MRSQQDAMTAASHDRSQVNMRAKEQTVEALMLLSWMNEWCHIYAIVQHNTIETKR